MLMLAPVTSEPILFSTGTLSPVSMDRRLSYFLRYYSVCGKAFTGRTMTNRSITLEQARSSRRRRTVALWRK
jgi:hypothetical protein